VPVLGVIISSVFVSVLMSMNYTKGLVEQFKFLMLMTTSTILIPYFFCTASYMIMRFKLPFKSSKYVALAILLAALTFIFCLWLMIGLGAETVFWGFFLTMTSVPIYVFAVWKRDKI
jgi:APA family basic amino acid/polyamine antiporter